MQNRPLVALVTVSIFTVSSCGSESSEQSAPGSGGAASRPSGAASQPTEPRGFAAKIEAAHGGSLYDKPALHADFDVQWGGGSMLAGDLVYDASTGRSRIESKDGGIATFDGQDGWAKSMAMPEGAPPPRFHLLTWPWFLAAPWKLRDPGSQLDEPKLRPLEDGELPSAKLTYDAGVGDTPDDWYVVYADPETHELAAVAYIVTFGTSVEKANEEPHAAKYDEFTEVDGLRVPSVLTFYNWNEAEGLVGEPIGKVTFSNLRFGTADDELFAKPDGATEAGMPR